MTKTFITADQLLRDSFALGAQILASGFRPTFLVGIWRGGAPIGIAVQEILEYHGVPTDHIAIRTSAYAGIDQAHKTVRVHGLDYLTSHLAHADRLLLIDDVFDSGRSLAAVLEELARRCRRNLPGEIRIATVYYKPARNRSHLVPDFFVHETADWLVFPHELAGLTPAEVRLHKPLPPELVAPVRQQAGASPDPAQNQP
jgi:hypoxanthine phosphoribosyltransferase